MFMANISVESCERLQVSRTSLATPLVMFVASDLRNRRHSVPIHHCPKIRLINYFFLKFISTKTKLRHDCAMPRKKKIIIILIVLWFQIHISLTFVWNIIVQCYIMMLRVKIFQDEIYEVVFHYI